MIPKVRNQEKWFGGSLTIMKIAENPVHWFYSCIYPSVLVLAATPAVFVQLLS
jgi:hypothetical protein